MVFRAAFMGCSGNIRRVLVVLGEGEHVYHGNSALVLFLIFSPLLFASVSFEPLLITLPDGGIRECPKLKSLGCSTGVSTVWSGAEVTGAGGRTETAFPDFCLAASRVGPVPRGGVGWGPVWDCFVPPFCV